MGFCITQNPPRLANHHVPEDNVMLQLLQLRLRNIETIAHSLVMYTSIHFYLIVAMLTLLSFWI